jgi:hypothetical protein
MGTSINKLETASAEQDETLRSRTHRRNKESMSVTQSIDHGSVVEFRLSTLIAVSVSRRRILMRKETDDVSLGI